VVAQVDDPYGKNTVKDEAQTPLKIGMFLNAKVEGKLLEGVFVLPRAAVRAGGEVILISKENRIRRQKVEPIWSDHNNVVIPVSEAGLVEGDVICLTPLAFPANGAKVSPTIDGVAPTIEMPAGKKPGGKGKTAKADAKSKPAET